MVMTLEDHIGVLPDASLVCSGLVYTGLGLLDKSKCALVVRNWFRSGLVCDGIVRCGMERFVLVWVWCAMVWSGLVRFCLVGLVRSC